MIAYFESLENNWVICEQSRYLYFESSNKITYLSSSKRCRLSGTKLYVWLLKVDTSFIWDHNTSFTSHCRCFYDFSTRFSKCSEIVVFIVFPFYQIGYMFIQTKYLPVCKHFWMSNTSTTFWILFCFSSNVTNSGMRIIAVNYNIMSDILIRCWNWAGGALSFAFHLPLSVW
jgi:hypothetical protein